MSKVAGARKLVHDVAGADYARALKIARAIAHPWYRCQALSSLAQQTTDVKSRNTLIHQAFDAALETAEPNRIVTVSSWPLRVLCERGNSVQLRRETERLLAIISTEPHPTRRGCALLAVLQAIEQGPADLFKEVLGTFRQTCLAGHGWRRDQNLFIAAELLNEKDHRTAVDLASLIEQPRARRRALRSIGEADRAQSIHEDHHT